MIGAIHKGMARLTPAVMRTLDILELFLEAASPLTAPEVARKTGIPRTTVHELLTTLVAREYLVRDEPGTSYRLGVRFLHLGNAYASRFDLLSAANSVAREFADQSGETVNVAVREGANVFYLAKVQGRDNLRLPSSIGQRVPANVTALGKVLLSELPDDTLDALFPDAERLPALTERSITTLNALKSELRGVRERGVAFEDRESAPDSRCAAAPVRDSAGEIIAAISVSVPVARWDQRPEGHWVQVVQRGAIQLSEQLGYVVRPSA